MSFLTDKQTLDDLNLTGKYNRNSVFSLFNNTVTRGGERLLEKMFASPFTSVNEINRRSGAIALFGGLKLDFPFTREEFSRTEDYFTNVDDSNLVLSVFANIRRKTMHLIANKQDYVVHREGFAAALVFLHRLKEFSSSIMERSLVNDNTSKGASIAFFSDELEQVSAFLRKREIRALLRVADDPAVADKTGSGLNTMPFWEFCRYDHLLRYTFSAEIMGLLRLMHKVDLYISVGRYGVLRGFNYAVCHEPGGVVSGTAAETDTRDFRISMKGVYHPAVDNAVANDIEITSGSNFFFLTGANMAGKSTLMKSFSTAVYLAHMGFPVPCDSMEFTVMDGMYTSINVPDNLNLGYSHFYAEVMRVKMIAEAVAGGCRLVVIFDEMFKGTNVKDAFDATLSVSEAFCNKRESAFIVSTHIMEVAAELDGKCEGVQFWYLPTLLREGSPFYSYLLETGVSDDRFGMTIINNEKIVEIIKNSPFYEDVCIDA